MIARKRMAALVAGAGLFLCVSFMMHSFVPVLEQGYYDMMLRLKQAKPVNDIVIVGIDGKSIAEVGGFPWPRATMAALVNRIREAGPKIVAMDFMFPRREQPGGNDSLERAFQQTPNLILPFQANAVHDRNSVAAIPAEAYRHRFLLLQHRERLARRFFYASLRIDISDKRFFQHASRSGFVNVSTSRFGQKLREIVHVIRAGDEYFPSFAIAIAAAWYELAPDQVALDGGAGIALGGRTVPLSSYAGSSLLNFRGRAGTITTISAADILAGRADAAALRDKIALVGITDPGAAPDLFITPVGSKFPGVEIWATATADIIEGTWIRPAEGMTAFIPWLLALAIFPGVPLAVRGDKKRLALGAGIGLMIAGFGASAGLFLGAGMFVNPGSALYAWIFSLIWLAAEKPDPTLAASAGVDLEPVDAGDADDPPAPAGNDFIASIPRSATARHVAEKISQRLPALQAPRATMVEASLADAECDGAADSQSERADSLVEEFSHLAGGKIVRFIGSGGMADVYLVWHSRLEVYRAIKVIKPGQSSQLLDRFETEIRIFASLNHPNIVQCYGAGDWHSLPYLEMEYVPGAAMDEVIAQCGRLSPEQTLAIGILVCRALHYAHQRTVTVYGKTYKGVVHRDLKPANVMLSRGGKIKLTDFGIARPRSVSLHTLDSGKVVGTLPYLAPEQLDGKQLSARTDIYALGAMMHELVTGRRAFPQADVTALVNAKTRGQVQSLRASGTAPERMAAVIERAMAQRPQDRYDSASEMGRELERILRSRVQADHRQFIGGLVKRFWG